MYIEFLEVAACAYVKLSKSTKSASRYAIDVFDKDDLPLFGT